VTAAQAAHNLQAAMRWQAACFGMYGVGVVIRRMGRADFEVIHAPELCCGHSAHKEHGRKGACPRHHPFGANRFCAECYGPWDD